MSTDGDLRALISLYGELAQLLGEIQQAVIAADTSRLSELVPRQEELMRRVDTVRIPASLDPALARELVEAAAEAMRRNTTNHVLLAEQLGLIQETMKAILGEQQAVNRLA